jgi:hypothetical protein
MTKSVKKLSVMFGSGALLLVLAGASPATAGSPSGSPASTGTPGPAAAELTRESVTVTAIDRAKRSVTLQNADGDTKSVKVPEDMKSFDTLKVGDKIDIEYYESVSVNVLPAGTKPTMSESTSGGRTGEGSAATAREMQISGTVLAVDAKANKVTIKGPRGNTRTVNVSDPQMQKKLQTLKPGQVVQLTYTEGVAASIRPTSK